MGNVCGLKKTNEDPQNQLKSSKLRNEELKYLELMYNDLASRSKENKLTRQVFDTFFHLNGMWGQEMFRSFDQNKEGLINFDEFKHSIELMVRGTFRQRAQLLFQFYDVDKTGGVSYSQLLRMLYSYPKEDLRVMVTNQKFLETIDNLQLTYYFGPEKELNDKIIIEEDEEKEDQSETIERKQSEYLPTSTQIIMLQGKLWDEVNKIKESKVVLKEKQKNLGDNLESRKERKNRRERNTMIGKIGSLAAVPTYIKKKSMKLTSNIASLVKKYAVFIFKELHLNRFEQEINLDQFLEIVHNQPSIFTVYMGGFHLYIWELQEDGCPQYTKITPWIEGICSEVHLKEKNIRYLRYIRTTLFIYNSPKSKTPIEIKNLEGLIVEEIQSAEHGLGICFKHRDGIYPQKQYYFESKESQKQWLRLMADFKLNNIYNKYVISEKIGEGNFSSVYQGNERESKKQVAIKVIEKFKLSLNEKEVIKFECRILELCHHPNIVQFYQYYSTKSNIYIVTELMTEGDLFEYTKKFSFLEEYQAATILKQLIEAIHYLNHQLGLIHRDLKPENVLIQTNKDKKEISRVKIIDFGFAVYKSNLKNLSDKEKYAGTPGFVAPEVYLMEDFDEGVDMFSLGIIMFFMLCGHLPFYSPIYEDIREQTIECNVNLNNMHWMNISDNAKDLINKILVCKEQRINCKQALDHPWLRNIQELRSHCGKNKKKRYI